MNNKFTFKNFLVVFFTTIFIVALFLSIRLIPAGKVGVVKRFGKTTGTTFSPGLHFIIPFVDSVTEYSTRKLIYETTTAEKQKGSKADYKDYPVDTNTKDGQQVDIFYTIRFSVDPAKAEWILNNIGNENDLVEKVVKTESRIWMRNIPREYSADTLYTGDVVEVQNRVEEKLTAIFSQNGLILDSVGVREIKFTDEYVKAIEQKQIEAVKVETEKNVAEQAKYRKEAQITEAEAQAKSQELLRQSITKEILQKMWIEKWNGQLPRVVTGNGSIMDISTLIK